MDVQYDYSRNMEPVVYRGEACHISLTSDLAANIYVPSEDRNIWVPFTSLTPSLFAEALDGPTFEDAESAYCYRESLMDTGPVWSNYGGWIA